MIRIRNLTKYYQVRGGRRHYVLRDANITIPANQSIGILGPNGAGKSTLLRMIGGAESPNKGTIETSSSISWPLGLRAGFQGSLTGRQNIMFVCRINGLDDAETEQVMDAVTLFSELGEYFDMPISSYSSGMRARLGFGLSINFDFDYYLIDELTAVGDATFRKKAKAEFEKIKKNSSLIFVSHNLKNLKQTCDSAIFLHDGNMSYYEKVDEGIDHYNEYMRSKRKASKAKSN